MPAETFAEVVSVLDYYDLFSLKMASKKLSADANQCADAIRLFDFSDLEFQIWVSSIRVYRFSYNGWPFHSELKFESENDMAEFITEAFRAAPYVVLCGRQIVIFFLTRLNSSLTQSPSPVMVLALRAARLST